MSSEENPVVHIVAGPNGAGKTTFAMDYLAREEGVRDLGMKTSAQAKVEGYAERGLRALHRAVRAEFEKKSKLGQYVIVLRNGKTVRMLASEVLAEADSAEQSS